MMLLRASGSYRRCLLEWSGSVGHHTARRRCRRVPDLEVAAFLRPFHLILHTSVSFPFEMKLNRVYVEKCAADVRMNDIYIIL